MISIAAFLFTIGLLVFIHELGHFAVAKWCGVRVEQFSLGFGPALFKFTRGETEYKICLLPLGGYVNMTGESEDPEIIVENIPETGESPFEKGDRIVSINGEDVAADSRWSAVMASLHGLAAHGEIVVKRKNSEVVIKAGYTELEKIEAYSGSEYPRSFSKKSVPRRMSIVAAGPIMNFVLPFLLIPAAFIAGVYVPAYIDSEPVVAGAPHGAGKSPIQKGDKIMSVEGQKVGTWNEVSGVLRKNTKTNVEVAFSRDGRTFETQVPAAAIWPELIAEERKPVVGSVTEGYPAYKAGIRPGDAIVAVAGKEVGDWDRMAQIIRNSPGRETAFTLIRKGETVRTSVVPVVTPGTKNAAIGITMQREQKLKKFGLTKSVSRGVKSAAAMVAQVVSLFFGLVFSLVGGEVSLGDLGKTVAGPLFIAKMSGSMAEQGIASLLMFASFISVNLAVINLLPIPVLDGGHLVWLTVEAIRRKPLPRAAVETAHRIGFSLLITLMIIATYNDVSNLWGEITGFLKSFSGLIG